MNELLVLFGYPSGVGALLGGVLPLRYCSGRFACRVPTWGLPARGDVQGLIAKFAGVEEVSRNEHVGRALLPGLVGGSRVLCSGRILGNVQSVRQNSKTPAHLAGCGSIILWTGLGLGRNLGMHGPTSPGSA